MPTPAEADPAQGPTKADEPEQEAPSGVPHAHEPHAHAEPHRRSLRDHLAELMRFGAVGGVAYVVDIGLFNLLRFGPGELLVDRPLTAKIASAAVATLVAWLGNRYWAFARHRTATPGRELGAFVLANIGGAAIAVGCLWFSHYVLGLTSPLADNISANVVGLVLGTAFRYVAYKWFVFTGGPA